MSTRRVQNTELQDSCRNLLPRTSGTFLHDITPRGLLHSERHFTVISCTNGILESHWLTMWSAKGAKCAQDIPKTVHSWAKLQQDHADQKAALEEDD